MIELHLSLPCFMLGAAVSIAVAIYCAERKSQARKARTAVLWIAVSFLFAWLALQLAYLQGVSQ